MYVFICCSYAFAVQPTIFGQVFHGLFFHCVFTPFFSLQLAIEIVIDIDIEKEIEIENGAEQHFTGLVVVAQQQAICCRGLK